MLDKLKNKRKLSKKRFILFIIVIFLIVSVIISQVKFNVWNPYTVASGLTRIMFSDAEVIELKKAPKVILAKPNIDLFIEYMDEQGYDVVKGEQLGSMYVFDNRLTNNKSKVYFSMNKYYSLWVWD